MTTINYNLGEKIYIIIDISSIVTKAILSVGNTWEELQPVVFDLSKYILARRNYSIHKQEMLAIV